MMKIYIRVTITVLILVLIFIYPGTENNLSYQDRLLVRAAGAGATHIVKVLLLFTREPMAKNEALFMAIVDGHADIVKMLIENDANINQNGKRASLILAVLCGRPKIVKELINGGANINACDSPEGWTPLTYAVNRGNIKIAKILLSAGADTYSKHSAIAVAIQHKNTELINLLKSNGVE